MEVLLSRDDEKRTEHTRCTNSGVNELCSDDEAAVSDDPLDDQLPRMLLPALSTKHSSSPQQKKMDAIDHYKCLQSA